MTITPAKILRWENPPPARHVPGRRGSQFDELADILRDEPARWAVVYDGDNPTAAGSIASKVKTGNVKCFAPAGSFEATVRKLREGRIAVYARYVGGGGGPW